MHRLAAAAMLAACGGSTPPAALENASRAAPPPTTIEPSLRGPLRDADLPPFVVRAEARRDGRIVRLLELPAGLASSSCVVAIETAAGHYHGRYFFCAADRSDEHLVLERVAIELDGEVATLRFTVASRARHGDPSLRVPDGPPTFEHHAITCRIGAVLGCDDPPPVGGYDVYFDGEL